MRQRSIVGLRGTMVLLASSMLFGGCLGESAVDAVRIDDVADVARLNVPVDARVPTLRNVATPAQPAAVTGGTMAVTMDGRLVVAHPQLGGLFLLEPDGGLLSSTDLGSEPGRMVTDATNRIHLVMRQAGTVRAYDDVSLELLGERPVCASPRGIAHDPATDSLHVACADGWLVTMPAEGGPETRRVFVDTDLRDVVVDGDRLYVSRFHSAELLVLDGEGSLVSRSRPADSTRDVERPATADEPEHTETLEHSPGVAFRIVSYPTGGVLMLHQQMLSSSIEVSDEPLEEQVEAALRVGVPRRSSYGQAGRDTVDRSGGFPALAGCGEIVETVLTWFDEDGNRERSVPLADGFLHVDVAVYTTGAQPQVALASAARSISGQLGSLRVTPEQLGPRSDVDCLEGTGGFRELRPMTSVTSLPDGRLAFLLRDERLVRVTDPLMDFAADRLIYPERVQSRGFDEFYAVGSSGVACASCHPEGGEDGHTWRFDPTGSRRTQTLAVGGVTETAPFHWNAEASTMNTIVVAALLLRMGGQLSPDTSENMSTWMDSIPAPNGIEDDPEAALRGEALFSGSAECATCHSGGRFSNEAVVDVGTGGSFNVPGLLGVAYRAPYLHDGCAPTLDAVVAGACDTLDVHGRTSHLSDDSRADIVAFLRSL